MLLPFFRIKRVKCTPSYPRYDLIKPGFLLKSSTHHSNCKSKLFEILVIPRFVITNVIWYEKLNDSLKSFDLVSVSSVPNMIWDQHSTVKNVKAVAKLDPCWQHWFIFCSFIFVLFQVFKTVVHVIEHMHYWDWGKTCWGNIYLFIMIHDVIKRVSVNVDNVSFHIFNWVINFIFWLILSRTTGRSSGHCSFRFIVL